MIDVLGKKRKRRDFIEEGNSSLIAGYIRLGLSSPFSKRVLCIIILNKNRRLG